MLSAIAKDNMYCTQCDRILAVGAKFCGACGAATAAPTTSPGGERVHGHPPHIQARTTTEGAPAEASRPGSIKRTGMKALKVLFVVVGTLGILDVVVDGMDVVSGAQPQGVLTHLIIALIGIGGYVGTNLAIRKQTT